MSTLRAQRGIGPAIAAIVLVAVAGCRSTSARPRVTCFETPEWARAGGIDLRLEPDGVSLLLRHRSTVRRLADRYPGADPGTAVDEPDVVYRYDPAGGSLEPVDSQAWQVAATPSVDCEQEAALPTDPFALDAPQGAVRWRGRAVPLAGDTALLLVAEPEGERVAVLSAKGAAAGSVAPFLGRGGAAGQHYHQAFRRQDASEQGRAVALPMTSETVALAACWCAGGRYTVYADVLFQRVCIVAAENSAGDVR